MSAGTLGQIVAVFAPLSLLSFGGGQAVLADIGKQVSDVHHWLTQAEFVEAFALSRAAPGPGSLLSPLIGWKVAGLAGALAALVALFGPSSLLAFVASRLWSRARGHPWHRILEHGLTPIAGGLILASAWRVLASSSGAVSVWLTALAAAALFIRYPRLNPLAVLAIGGLLQIALHAPFWR